MVDHSVVIKQGVNISDSVTVGASIIFEFYERLYVGGTILGSPEIEIKRDQSDPHYITGFEIKVTDPSDAKLNQAKEKGNVLLNYLSSKTGLNVRSKVPMIARVFSDHSEMMKSITADAVLVRNFDLDISKLSLLLSGNPELNKRISGYRRGIAGYENYDFEGSVTGYFQVLEYTRTPEEDKFRPLRHACSHEKLNDPDAVKDLNGFGINCTVGFPVNFNDPDNYKALVQQTKALKAAADNYIAAELARLSL